MSRVAALLSVVLVALPSALRAQGLEVRETRVVTSADSSLLLRHELIVPGSLHLVLDSVYTLQPELDYRLDARFGAVRLTEFLRRLLIDTTREHRLDVTYRYRPLRLPRELFRRELVLVEDSLGRREVAQAPGAAEPIGGTFQRSGGVVRGVTVGSNRDLTLQSRLWLQFSGKITEDVEVLGAVTDEQTPIQPEGNTQTLREVDNIFIEFRSPYVGGTVGKFSTSSTTSEWTAFSRKLQGIRVVGRYGGLGTTEIVAAVSPGRFHTMQLQGRERDQGPYRLTGPSGERTILVVAGTERVFVDGVAMVRGEGNDYVIDYSTGEITFETRQPITSASRISVDFEYTDRQYSRSFVSVANTGYLFDSTVTLSANYVREADNPDATIDITLTEADRALLAAAGSDRQSAVRSGAVWVGRNDTVRGVYYRIDTLIAGQPDSVYVYAPDDPRSVYAVSFTVAPAGEGAYRSVAFGQYEYVGRGRGAYLPVVYLPMPQLRQIFAVAGSARVAPGVTLTADVALADASLNRLSTVGAASSRGLAAKAALAARDDSLTLAGLALGAVSGSVSARFVDAGFLPIERLGEVEFSNQWNARSRIGESGYDDLLAEANLAWLPIRELELGVQAGLLERGDLFSSLRQLYSARLTGVSFLPNADYAFERIGVADTLRGRRSSVWIKHRAGLSRTIGIVTPGVRLQAETREDRAATGLTDTLYPGSFRFLEVSPELRLALPWLNVTGRASYRVDDSVRHTNGGDRFLRDGASQTYTVRGELRGVRDLNSSLDVTFRRKTYDSVANVSSVGRLDNETILARSRTRWSGFDRALDLDGLYEVQTQQSARVQRVFVRVPYGQGQYRWDDRDSNGVQSEYEFVEAIPGEGEFVRFELATDELFPIIDLGASLRLRFQPRRLFGAETGAGRIFGPVSTETYLRVDEKSQTLDESDVYLLRLSTFRDDSTTLSGTSIVQQDLHLFEGNPEYSVRFRYQDRRGLTKLVQRVERRSDVERSLRARWAPLREIGLQLDLISSDGLLTSSDRTFTQGFDLNGLTLISDFSYRPEQSLEIGWKLRLSSTEDVLPAIPRTIALGTNELRAEYAIETRGRLRASVERTTVSGVDPGIGEVQLPYQLTDGYSIGTTWLGRLTLEYRFGSNMQASITYTGRAQPPTSRVVHTGQAEVRAFF